MIRTTKKTWRKDGGTDARAGREQQKNTEEEGQNLREEATSHEDTVARARGAERESESPEPLWARGISCRKKETVQERQEAQDDATPAPDGQDRETKSSAAERPEAE